MVDIVLKDLVGEEYSVYVDDIIVFSKTAEHDRRLANVLEGFSKSNQQLHPGKCAFAQPQSNYLGFLTAELGLRVSG